MTRHLLHYSDDKIFMFILTEAYFNKLEFSITKKILNTL